MARGPVKDGICRDGDKWYVVLREPDPTTGTSRMVWHSGFRSSDEAKAFRDERRLKIRQGQVVRKDRMTMKEYLEDHWLPQHLTDHEIESNTLATYKLDIKHICHFMGKKEVQKVTDMDIAKMYRTMLNEGSFTGKPLSRRSVERVGVTLRMALKAAVKPPHRIIPHNVAEDVTIPRPSKKAKPDAVFSSEEIRAIQRACPLTGTGALFYIEAAFGHRRGMAMGLKWDALDLDNAVIRFRSNRVKGEKGMEERGPKSDKWTVLPIDPETLAWLKEWRTEQKKQQLKSRNWLDAGYVCTNRNGGPLHPSNVYRVWREILKTAGVPYRNPHQLRHTSVTAMLEAGVPLHQVAEWHGHADTRTTSTLYSHVTPQGTEQAAEALRKWRLGQ